MGGLILDVNFCKNLTAQNCLLFFDYPFDWFKEMLIVAEFADAEVVADFAVPIGAP